MTAPVVVLGNDTVTVLKRAVSSLDRFNVQVLTDTPTVVPGCSMQPNMADEVIGDTDFTVAMWILRTPVLPIFQTLTAADAIRVAMVNGVPNVVFEDFGDPLLWTDAQGNPHHYQIKLRKARG